MALNLFANKADLEAAQSQIASLQSDLQTAQAELQSERDANATHAQTIADLQASVTNITAERDTATESISALTTERDNLAVQLTTAQASAETRAAEIVANNFGATPLENVDDKIDSKVKSRKEFNQLSPQAKSEFCKTGGKIV